MNAAKILEREVERQRVAVIFLGSLKMHSSAA
jgi:hypothetical protein